MGNCLFLPAQEWGIDRQERKKLQIPGGAPGGGGMVTGRIEPCITICMNSIGLNQNNRQLSVRFHAGRFDSKAHDK